MVLLGKPLEEGPLEAATCQMEGKLKQIFQKEGVMTCTGLMWLGIGTDGRLCEHGNEPSVSTQCG